jgi:hypothetical protein
VADGNYEHAVFSVTTSGCIHNLEWSREQSNPVAACRGTEEYGCNQFCHESQPQPTPDELAYSMDIAIGERFTVAPSSTVESNSDRQASPTAEGPESNMEIAIGARAGG